MMNMPCGNTRFTERDAKHGRLVGLLGQGQLPSSIPILSALGRVPHSVPDEGHLVPPEPPNKLPPGIAADPGVAVPGSRLARLAHLGGMAGGVAGGMLVEGARQIVQGRRPGMSDLLMTPATVGRITRHLAQMRGAAMKIGQLLSMDAGQMLPPELSSILATLRAEARPMPAAQLKTVLAAEWGPDWLRKFESFSVQPLAAASIGQVHRARTRDGRDLAIKVQYPGVRRSIDSDVDNLGTLIRLSGAVPKEIDLAPLLAEARRQLHEEADYAREAESLARFGALLDGAPDYIVPEVQRDLCTGNLLAMTFLDGVPVESLDAAPQAERDRIAALMIDLVLREIFVFGAMQTDPNFANYRYDPRSGRLVLLDFGAVRDLPTWVAEGCRRLGRAGFAAEPQGVREGMLQLGLFGPATEERHQAAFLAMFEVAMAPLRQTGWHDFADPSIFLKLRDEGEAIARARDFWHVPPVDTLYLQRKVGGIYLLASRLKARLDLAGMLAPYLGT